MSRPCRSRRAVDRRLAGGTADGGTNWPLNGNRCSQVHASRKRRVTGGGDRSSPSQVYRFGNPLPMRDPVLVRLLVPPFGGRNRINSVLSSAAGCTPPMETAGIGNGRPGIAVSAIDVRPEICDPSIVDPGRIIDDMQRNWRG